MTLVLTNRPAQRGGHAPGRPNTRQEARGNQIASQWSGRDLNNQSRADLEKARVALLDCGTVANSPVYNRAGRLLTQINAVLASNNA